MVQGRMIARDEVKAWIEKFDVRDFGYWRIQFVDYFYGKRLHLTFLIKKPGNINDANENLLNRHILGVIRLIMSTLCLVCIKSHLRIIMYTMKKLLNFKMAKCIPIVQYLDDFILEKINYHSSKLRLMMRFWY